MHAALSGSAGCAVGLCGGGLRTVSRHPGAASVTVSSMKGLVYGFWGTSTRTEASALTAQLKLLNAGWKGTAGQLGEQETAACLPGRDTLPLEVLPGVDGPVCCVGLQPKETASAEGSTIREQDDRVRNAVAGAARALVQRGARYVGSPRVLCSPTVQAPGH